MITKLRCRCANQFVFKQARVPNLQGSRLAYEKQVKYYKYTTNIQSINERDKSEDATQWRH